MADVITRFRLETTQFDSKLRDESQRLADLTNHLSMAGKDFERFAKNHVQTAASLGQVASGATNLKDKLKDLVGAYNTAARAYNTLTKDQQSGDFGKAMATSLQKLKQDITQTKNELYNIGEQSKGTGGIMSQLAEKFTINIDAMKLFKVGMQAVQGALKVAKDAFFASEANVDEWGRTMQSAQALYEGFLNALNTGDISGYLNNMADIVRAASAAYDELDKLGTMKTIQGPQMSFQQTENDRIRMMIQTGRYIAPRDGRLTSSTMKEGDLLSPEQIRAFEGLLKNGMNRMVGLVGNEVKQANRAIDAYYSSLAKQNGMSLSEFRQGTSSWESFSKKLAGYEDYKKHNDKLATEFAKQGGRGFVDFDKNNPYAEFKKWGIFRVDKQGENSFNDLVGLIKQRDQQISQSYGMLSQSYRAINRAEGITVKGLMGGGSGGGGGKNTPKTGEILPAGSVAELTKQIQELQKEQSKATSPEEWKSYQEQIRETTVRIKVLKGEMSAIGVGGLANAKGVTVATDKAFGTTQQKMKASEWVENRTEELQKGKLDFSGIDKQIAKIQKGGKDVAESWKTATSAVNTFGSVLGAIEDPAAKVAATVAQAIASVALAYAETLAKDQTTKSNVWAFIAAAAAATVSMATTIASIHSSTGYAEGGIIKGNHYSGDMIGGQFENGQLVGLNAQEVVLNRAQSGNLASQLQGGGVNNFQLETRVSGDDLRIILRRSNMKRGYGSRNLVL